MSIIISPKGQPAQKLDRAEFEKEDYLQNYIHENPESIPVYEIQEDKKLFVVARELSTESGPIDALAIDKDGDIYVVETKLYRNPAKRTVVAQALDYGASLWKHTNNFEEFIGIINQEVQKKFKMTFQEKAKIFFEIDDEQINLMLENMKFNLKDGNIKFVILMDSMDERLKDLIIYVNQNSRFDIYAVQLEYYKFQEYEIIIPKIFGVEVKKNVKTSNIYWNKESILNELKEVFSEKALNYVKRLYELFEKENLKISYGRAKSYGFFSAKLEINQKKIEFLSVVTDPISFSFLCDEEFVSGKFKNLRLGFADEGKKIIPELEKFYDIEKYWTIDLEFLNEKQFLFLIKSLKEIIYKIKN